MLDIFDKMILPILLYGCEVWGYENVESIEIFYRRFLKYLLRVNPQTTNCMIYGETGRTPLILKIKLRMVCFWYRIVTGRTNKLSFKLLDLLNKCQNEPENSPMYFSSAWLQQIKHTLITSGMEAIWLNPELCNLVYLKRIISNNLSDVYNNKWHNEISVKSSCKVYRLIKENLKIEKYLTLLDCSDRITISKFRCRNSKIPAVIQGYHNVAIPYEERMCPLCDMNEIGDEFHYIMQCPAFARHRNIHINTYYLRNPSMAKFVQLFQSVNVKTQIKLAKMIREINYVFR